MVREIPCRRSTVPLLFLLPCKRRLVLCFMCRFGIIACRATRNCERRECIDIALLVFRTTGDNRHSRGKSRPFNQLYMACQSDTRTIAAIVQRHTAYIVRTQYHCSDVMPLFGRNARVTWLFSKPPFILQTARFMLAYLCTPETKTTI